jgi:hypothetical protein
MSREVAKSLRNMNPNDPIDSDAPGLVFPRTRGQVLRVSEQESKILVSQWLQDNGFIYSIETPTSSTYRQKGKVDLSARTDVTVYHSRDLDSRALNIELKSGNPPQEQFRKDLEKLLQEKTDGLWFHTLTNANPATWKALEGKIQRSLEDPTVPTDAATHSIHFAFCVLQGPKDQYFWDFNLDFGGDWVSQLGQGFGPHSVIPPIIPLGHSARPG